MSEVALLLKEYTDFTHLGDVARNAWSYTLLHQGIYGIMLTDEGASARISVSLRDPSRSQKPRKASRRRR
jgi:hypothetical protein